MIRLPVKKICPGLPFQGSSKGLSGCSRKQEKLPAWVKFKQSTKDTPLLVAQHAQERVEVQYVLHTSVQAPCIRVKIDTDQDSTEVSVLHFQ